MDRKTHWETIFAQKQPEGLTWYQEYPRLSLQLIEKTGVTADGRIIDVGGGTSFLVDYLLTAGFRNVTVLDISDKALALNQERLGDKAQQVTWISDDVTTAQLLPNHYDVWHDRAVFHFLTDPKDRQLYREAVLRSLRPGGHLIVSTFAFDGPEKCSGLDVVRYGEEDIQAAFGDEFDLLLCIDEDHHTPWDTTQKFTYFHLRRNTPA